MSSVSYLPQPGTAKIKMFSHDFEGFHFKKQNVEVKKGIGLCCPDFDLLKSLPHRLAPFLIL